TLAPGRSPGPAAPPLARPRPGRAGRRESPRAWTSLDFGRALPYTSAGFASRSDAHHGRSEPPVPASHRGEDLPPRRGRPPPRAPGAPARRLPPVGLPRGDDADVRVLRRAGAGHRRGGPGGDVPLRRPRHRPHARPAGGRDAADRPDRRDAAPRPAEAVPAGVPHQRLPPRGPPR